MFSFSKTLSFRKSLDCFFPWRRPAEVFAAAATAAAAAADAPAAAAAGDGGRGRGDFTRKFCKWVYAEAEDDPLEALRFRLYTST